MTKQTDPSLDDAIATREIKRLYFVMLRIMEEDDFMDRNEIEVHARRLHRIFITTLKIYLRHDLSPKDLEQDFNYLLNKLIDATLADELYEKTANLTKVQTRLQRLCDLKAIEEFPLKEAVAV